MVPHLIINIVIIGFYGFIVKYSDYYYSYYFFERIKRGLPLFSGYPRYQAVKDGVIYHS